MDWLSFVKEKVTKLSSSSTRLNLLLRKKNGIFQKKFLDLPKKFLFL
jgi:hypothetical protein